MKKLTLLSIFLLTNACGSLGSLMPSEKFDEETLASLEGPDVTTVQGGLLSEAKKAEQKDDYVTALQYYKELVSKDENNLNYQYRFAENLRKIGQNEVALKIYDKLLAKDYGNLDYKESKALALMGMTEFTKAGALFTDIMNTDPVRWRSINGAGLIFAMDGKYAEANEYFELAKDVKPYESSIYNNQGMAKALTGNYGEAISLLKKASEYAVARSHKKRHIDLNLALVNGIAGNSDVAKKIATPHLSEAQLYNNLGFYSYLAKDKQLARAYLNKALTTSQVHYQKAWDNLDNVN